MSYAVGATPGGPIAVRPRLDLHYPSGGMFFQEGGVIGHPVAALVRFHFQSVSQAPVPEFGVMAIGFAVGGGLDHPSFALSHPVDAVDEGLAGNKGPLEGDTPRDAHVVKKNVDGSFRAVPVEVTVSHARVHPAVGNIGPVPARKGSYLLGLIR